MGFLLAKIVLLFLLAALLGAWLTWWWLRRRYQDVTTEYTRLEGDWQGWRRALDAKLEALPRVELAPITARLDGVERSITRLGALGTGPVVDLGPVQRQLAELERGVRGLPAPPAPTVDLAETHQRLAALSAAVAGIRFPEARPVDLAPLRADLGTLSTRLGAVEEVLRRAPSPAGSPPVDLAPTHERLEALERAVRSISFPATTPVDLEPVLQKLAALEARGAPPPAAPAAPAGPVVRAGSRNLLARAAFGKPDDLKEIKGVARVLERMLHRIGVYYFWQIAEWTPEDVAHANAKLTAFRGRVQRDGWVDQCVGLASAPGAARRPESL